MSETPEETAKRLDLPNGYWLEKQDGNCWWLGCGRLNLALKIVPNVPCGPGGSIDSEVEKFAAALAEKDAEIERLQAHVEAAQNDLADALGVKRGQGPTALSMMVAERDRLRTRLAAAEIAKAGGEHGDNGLISALEMTSVRRVYDGLCWCLMDLGNGIHGAACIRARTAIAAVSGNPKSKIENPK